MTKCIVICLVFVSTLVFSWVPPAIARPVSQSGFLLYVVQPLKDRVGTNVENIRVFKIFTENQGVPDGSKYTLRIYLDGNYIHWYPDIKLPYEFKQNFSGISSGAHNFKIEISDPQGVVLSTLETTIDVTH
ncbi:MAG: hypothetical protein AB7S78_00615 [Candidatus Omnitrophota bacterium]